MDGLVEAVSPSFTGQGIGDVIVADKVCKEGTKVDWTGRLTLDLAIVDFHVVSIAQALVAKDSVPDEWIGSFVCRGGDARVGAHNIVVQFHGGVDKFQLVQQIKVAFNRLLTVRRLHQEVNHLPACALVAHAQIVPHLHDFHVLVDEICEIKVGFERGGTVNGESRYQDGDHDDTHLLFLLHLDDFLRKDREPQRRAFFVSALAGKHHVEGTDKQR